MKGSKAMLWCLALLTCVPSGAAQAVQQAYIKASNAGNSDSFGTAVAVSGNTAVIAASGEDSSAVGVNGDQNNEALSGSGAVYVFVRNGSTWSQQAYLKASNPDAHDDFGRAVAISGDTIVVTAPSEDSGATGVNGNQADNSADSAGAAYVFIRSGTTWTQQAYLKAAHTSPFGSWYSVAIAGDTIVVGAGGDDSNATGVNGDPSNELSPGSGAAHVFVRSGTTWSQQAYLKASNNGPGDSFGHSVSVSGDTVVVGASGEASSATGVDGDQSNNSALEAGAAYVFTRSGTAWTQQAYLKASNTDADDRFGKVSVSGDTIAVGAWLEDSSATGVNGNQANNGASGAGAVYVFARSGTIWSQQAYLKASNAGGGDLFGSVVSVSGGTVAVGAYNESSNATGINGNEASNSAAGAGAAYVFVRSGTSWSQQAYVKSSNTEFGDAFSGLGPSLQVSGDALLVGAHFEDSSATGVNGNQADNSAPGAGAAYAFDLDHDAWTDLGSGLAGPNGIPFLFGTGTLVGGTFVTTTVSNLLPNSVALLCVGFSAINAPFKGGVWVPSFDLLIAGLPTGPSGLIDLPGTWTTGAPPGFSFYEQYWQKYAPGGFTASNAIKGTTP